MPLAGLIAALAGCTDPTFVPAQDAAGATHEEENEAGTPELDAGDSAAEREMSDAAADAADVSAVDDAASDALVTTSDADGEPSSSDAGHAGVLPAWALQLVGTYAKRSVNFSFDDDLAPTNTRNVEHSIVKISQAGGELSVSIQPCSFTVTLKDSPGTPLVFKHPDRYPPLNGRILLGEGNSFSSEMMVSHLGFDPERGKDCVGGRRAPYEDQSWLTTGTCQCFAGSLPQSLTDCRVTDTDRDGKPGITADNPGTFTTTYTPVSIVFDYAVTFAAGELKAGGQLELREIRAQAPACINASVDRCSVGKNQLCPRGSTKLIRLSEEVTSAGCEALSEGQFGPVDDWPAEVDCRAK